MVFFIEFTRVGISEALRISSHAIALHSQTLFKTSRHCSDCEDLPKIMALLRTLTPPLRKSVENVKGRVVADCSINNNSNDNDNQRLTS
jgi:hypothetical protein